MLLDISGFFLFFIMKIYMYMILKILVIFVFCFGMGCELFDEVNSLGC